MKKSIFVLVAVLVTGVSFAEDKPAVDHAADQKPAVEKRLTKEQEAARRKELIEKAEKCTNDRSVSIK